MCGCPVSGYQASYRESESEHVFATGHASSVACSRGRSDASRRPRRCGSNSARVRRRRVEYERTSREARRSPASRPSGASASRRYDTRPAYYLLIAIRFAFWLRAGSGRSAPSPIRDRPVPGGKLSVDRILPAARDVLRSGAQRFTTGTKPCYCFVHDTATVL